MLIVLQTIFSSKITLLLLQQSLNDSDVFKYRSKYHLELHLNESSLLIENKAVLSIYTQLTPSELWNPNCVDV
jgi:hypothetical protein